MATTAYDLDNALITYLGTFYNQFTNTAYGKSFQGNNSEVRFTVTGTDATISFSVSATGTNYLQASIDGGAFADITSPGSTNTYTACTLFSGLSDAAHSVVIKHNTGTVTNVILKVPSGLSVTGASPALALSADCGPTYFAGMPSGWTHMVPEGYNSPEVLNGHNMLQANNGQGCDGGCRFRGNPTSISIFTQHATNIIWTLHKDGVYVGRVIPTADGKWGLDVLATGLDGAYHEYKISASAGVAGCNLVNVMLIGGDMDQTIGNQCVRRPAILWFGTSISVGTLVEGTGGGAVASDGGRAFPQAVSAAKGYACINNGKASQTILQITSTTFMAESRFPARMVHVDPLEVKYVWIELGTNDYTLTQSEVQAAYVRLLIQIRKSYRSATIYCAGTLNNTAMTAPQRAAINATISAAVTAAVTALGALAGTITYINMDGVINTGTDLADTVHPLQAGHDKYTAAILPNFVSATTLYPISTSRVLRSRIITRAA